ncbi:unnamed protein product [Rodentolepis nana]|uniref:Secreted protein n=1 Tax=Rodentolepis nana TaxID=102285 RepID=A0A0R3TKR1_RODNA|nr:unnamed protein product [Rodentolepis nana]
MIFLGQLNNLVPPPTTCILICRFCVDSHDDPPLLLTIDTSSPGRPIRCLTMFPLHFFHLPPPPTVLEEEISEQPDEYAHF